MNLDPRKRFRDTPNGKTWSNAVASDWFQEGLITALTAMNLDTAVSTDMGTSAAVACRAEGARKFVNIMLTLTDTKQETKGPGTPHNLTPTQ